MNILERVATVLMITAVVAFAGFGLALLVDPVIVVRLAAPWDR